MHETSSIGAEQYSERAKTKRILLPLRMRLLEALQVRNVRDIRNDNSTLLSAAVHVSKKRARNPNNTVVVE
jgi:hypothetical protein